MEECVNTQLDNIEVFLTLNEAADLEGINYKNLAQKINRNKDTYKVRTEKPDNGGKDRIYIALSSLSKQARKAYKERAKINTIKGGDIIMEKIEQSEMPWYVDVDLDWYIENNKQKYYEGVELGNQIREFLAYEESDRTIYADEFADKLGISQRTLYRYAKSYLEASAWAYKMQRENHGNYDFYKVLSLCRKPKETGRFPSFTEETKQVIKNIWFNAEFAQNQGTKEMLYEKLQAVANLNNWDRIPSYQSVARYINYLMEDEGMRNAYFLASKGIREYKNKVMTKASRDTSGLKVLEMVMGDEHTFDCWVSYKHPNGKVVAIKPKLVAWIDVRSRAIMGDIFCKDANSQILKQSLLKMIYSEIGGVPEYLYIDNGKDYTAETMTGRKRTDRTGNDLEFDDVTQGFYKSIGIKDDHRALPYEPWSKGQIERFFKTVCDKFTRWLTSYTGTLTGSTTSAKINKDINKMLEQGKLLTIEEFYERWSKWLHEVYMQKEHSSLKKLREEYITPYKLFMNAERYEKPAPPRSYATMLMMKSESILVRNIGISKFGYEYRADELWDYIGKKVDIKFDPDDVTRLYVFNKNGKKVCEAVSHELLTISPKVSQKALEEHIKAQKRQMRKDRELLEEARRPLEEINERYQGINSVTGGIDLMISGQGKKDAKVVTLPTDRAYREDISIGKSKADTVDSDYINRKAEKALNKLRAIGL